MALKTKHPAAVTGRILPHAPERLVAVAQSFENKAGRYELIRIEGDRLRYAFTNHQGHRIEADMAVAAWRRMQAKGQTNAGLPSAVVALLLFAAVATQAPRALAQSDSAQPVKTAALPEYPPTRSITLPGARPAAGQPQAGQPEKSPAEAPSGAAPPPEVIAASLALEPSSGDPNIELHYKTALLALGREDLTVAAEEMKEAAKAAPENAVVLYGLAVIQARNRQPELALPNLENALRLGLPGPESARAPGLLASIRYAIKKEEAEQRKVTPLKLWGSYEGPVEDPVQEFEDRAGRTIFKVRTPLSREMYLWKVDGESTVRGHWLEKSTLTEEIIYADNKRHDAKPKTITEEHWWLVTILINPDGSLDGSRIQTCTRETGFGCERPDPRHGAVLAFKGHVEPNGDLALTQGDEKQPLLLKKKSRVASTPPADVHIDVD